MKAMAAAAAIVLGSVVPAAQAPAQTNDAARLNAIAACGTIPKKSARLACFDAQSRAWPAGTEQAQPSFVPPGAPPQAASAAPVAAQPVPAAQQYTFGKATAKPGVASRIGNIFGRKGKAANRNSDMTEINEQATSAVDDGIGHYTITLATGARWKMTESSPGFAPPQPGDPVRIRKAALGSYLMDVRNQQSVRVSLLE